MTKSFDKELFLRGNVSVYCDLEKLSLSVKFPGVGCSHIWARQEYAAPKAMVSGCLGLKIN